MGDEIWVVIVLVRAIVGGRVVEAAVSYALGWFGIATGME
jgi:hypothetical protein